MPHNELWMTCEWSPGDPAPLLELATVIEQAEPDTAYALRWMAGRRKWPIGGGGPWRWWRESSWTVQPPHSVPDPLARDLETRPDAQTYADAVRTLGLALASLREAACLKQPGYRSKLPHVLRHSG